MRRIACCCTAVLLACSGGKPAPRPPPTPANVVAHAGDGQVTVLWDASSGALGYRVYSGEGALTSHTDVGGVTSWTVVGLVNGHTYSFAVSALGVGGESGLSTAVTATPQSNVPIAVASVTPADGTAGVARNAAVVVKFNRPAANVTAGCAGTVQLSDDAFATCAAGAFASSDAGATWTFTPSAPLHGSATYRLRVTTGVTATSGIALASEFDSAGFTTAAALTASVAPSGAVPLRPSIVVTFNRAVTAASVSSIESGTACSGSVQLSAGGACVAMTHTLSSNVATFTPVADLAPATAYAISVTTAVIDSDGVPLDAAVSGGFTTIAGVTVTGVDFQHISLAWTLPTGATSANVFVRRAGDTDWGVANAYVPPTTSATMLLVPGKTWDVKVDAVSSGDSTIGEIDSIATPFAGTAAEWLAGQLAQGEAGGHFRFTWSDTEFFAAYSNAADTATLQPANGDALWIAFDTDPAADASGEVRTKTNLAGTSEIIWPFKADYVVELKSGATNLRTIGATASWAPLAAQTKMTAGISEIRFLRSAIGNPASVRIALAAIGTNTGYTFDIAPARRAATEIPTIGFLGSITNSFPSVLDSASIATSVPAAVDAPSLVHFTVTGHTATGAMKIAGSLAPLSYDLSLSDYQLKAEGPDFEGLFNFGGVAGELFFKFMDGSTAEPIFSDQKDRVYTLSGAAASVPPLTWNVAYGSAASFHVVFNCSSGCSNAAELREFPAAGGFATLAAPFTGSADVTFTNRDFVTTPLQFKAYYPDTTYEGAPGSANHAMDDDVINTRTLTWTAGDGTNF